MTTTDQFQKQPDFYSTREECQARRPKIQTNPRYSGFNQVHFTVGDEEQFERYRYLDDMTSSVPRLDFSLSSNIFASHSNYIWDKYKSIELNAIPDTFRYLFHKFKKGIFVKIKDGKLKVFLPFSKANYTNEWSAQIAFDRSKFIDLARRASGGYYFDERKVDTNVEHWYGNSCLVRFEFPLSEGDSNVDNVKDMLIELCEKRELPDIEFFINRRDFPLLTRDGTEPYNNIWDTKTKPLVSHLYDKYAPVLSMSTSDRYADIAIPNHNDWALVQSKVGKLFSHSCTTDFSDTFATPWEEKFSTAVFRGTTTGCGVTTETNPRLKVSYMSKHQTIDASGVPYLDAGITKWNTRPRKLEGNSELQIIDVASVGFDKVGFLNYEQQSKYKYIIHIEGHVEAFRLSLELAMRMVILKVESQWKVWFSDMLIPGVHYIPVKRDLSDLIDKIKWCREHDEECKQIAINAREFYDQYLHKEGILDFMQKLFVDLSVASSPPSYPSKKPLDLLLGKEMQVVLDDQKTFFSTSKTIVHDAPMFKRTFGLLSGLHEAVKKTLSENTFTSSRRIVKLEYFRNKSTDVSIVEFASFPMAVKTTSDESKKIEFLHELFIGTTTTNKLVKLVPNFAYVFGIRENPDGSQSLIKEYIKGETLADYLVSQYFDFNVFLNILTQLLLALQVAQREFGFVHNDLQPWNVIITTLRAPIEVQYKIGADRVVSVMTSHIPTMIDFGKSKTIFKGIHHGLINPFQTSTVQDAISIILGCVKTLLPNRRVYDLNRVISLVNIFSGTRYLPSRLMNLDQLQQFLNRSSKYTSLMNDSKYELEDLTPIDVIQRIGYRQPVSVDPRLFNSITDLGNERQVFDFIFSSNDSERLASFMDVFSRVHQQIMTMKQPDDLLKLYYSKHTIVQKLKSLVSELSLFKNGPEVGIARTLVSEIEAKFSSYMTTCTPLQLDRVSVGKLVQATYNEETFLSSMRIEKAIQTHTATVVYPDLKYRLIETTFPFMSEVHKTCFRMAYDIVAKFDRLSAMNTNANKNTLEFLISSNTLKRKFD